EAIKSDKKLAKKFMDLDERESHIAAMIGKYVEEMFPRYQDHVPAVARQIDDVCYEPLHPSLSKAIVEVRGEKYLWEKGIDPAIKHVIHLQEKYGNIPKSYNDEEVGIIYFPPELVLLKIKTGKPAKFNPPHMLECLVENVKYQEWLEKVVYGALEAGKSLTFDDIRKVGGIWEVENETDWPELKKLYAIAVLRVYGDFSPGASGHWTNSEKVAGSFFMEVLEKDPKAILTLGIPVPVSIMGQDRPQYSRLVGREFLRPVRIATSYYPHSTTLHDEAFVRTIVDLPGCESSPYYGLWLDREAAIKDRVRFYEVSEWKPFELGKG
ncbi:MAG: hypothetical protein DRN90_07990, partial [Thermoproteota archaeon]